MKRASLLFAVLLAVPFSASAQQRLANINGSAAAAPYVDLGYGPEAVGGGTPVTLSHSASQTITAANSVHCGTTDTPYHSPNSYWRVFDLSEFGVKGDLEINSVEVGIEEAVGTGGSQPIELRLHTLSGPFMTANLTQIGSVAETLPDQSLSIFSFPVTDVTVPAGSVLVVEVFTPDGRDPVFNSIYIGTNADGQTDPSYLSAADCGITEPTDTAGIGFPNMHIVMNVLGDDIGVSANEAGSELPTSVSLGESYPNPFNPSATVPFTVTETAEVRLAVYDAQGREVAVLAAGTYTPGAYTASFDAAGLPSGTYLARLEANGQVQSRPLTLLK